MSATVELSESSPVGALAPLGAPVLRFGYLPE
jgi:hypothetical protein